MNKRKKWMSRLLLLTVLLLMVMTGCGKQNVQSSGSAESAMPEDNPTSRYAKLMGVQTFKETFKPRGKMTDHSGDGGSADREAPVSLLVSNIDSEANVFYYLDATDEVDLKDLEKEQFIPDFLKGLNKTSDTYHYSEMELMERGVNYYKFKVTINNKDTGEDLSSEEETVSESRSGTGSGSESSKDSASKDSVSSRDSGDSKGSSKSDNTAKSEDTESSGNTSRTEKASQSKNTGSSKKSAKSETSEDPEEAAGSESMAETEESGTVQKDEKPMVFIFVEKGEKTYELIGLDMEAESAESFTESFQGILDEIFIVKEVSQKASQ